MSQKEPQIKFPDDPIETLNKKLDKFFWVLFSVGFVFVVTLVVMVVTLLIDSFHFNSATYKEYSEKINTLNTLQESNNELLEQNIHKQELIVEQQEHIFELLRR